MATDRIVFGTGGLHSRDIFKEAWNAGYRVFDTAVYYSNDGELVAALDECGAGDEARLVHKVQPYRVTAQFERLIAPRLGGRRLDTLLLHHPALFVFDARPAALMKPWSELEKLVERGLVRRIGLSNAGASFVEYLYGHADVKPTVNQIECHPRQYDADLIRCCDERGLEVQCFSPLGGGKVPVTRSAPIQDVVCATGRSGAQVCLRWLIQKGLVPIVRASSPAHLRDNLLALSFSLDDAQRKAIDAIRKTEMTERVWNDPIKRGALSASVGPETIRVPNRLRFAIRSGLHYVAVEFFLRRRVPVVAVTSPSVS